MASIGRACLVLCALWSPLARASSALRPSVAPHASNYGESFTFVADLDDGTYLQLSLGMTNIGPGSLKGVCRAVVVEPDGKAWRAHTRVGRDAWGWRDGADTEQLTIGPCSVSAAERTTTVEVAVEGGTVQLAFGAVPTRRTLSDGAFAVGEDFYRTEILLYRVHVTGTVAVPGSTRRVVAGMGYLDHTRSTIRPRDLADRWVRFRALRGERGMLVLGRRGHDGRFTPVWACDVPGHCHHYPSFTLDRSGVGQSPSFRIALADGDAVDIRSGRLLYRDAPVEELGLLGKLVAPFVGSPVTYVYRARLTDNGGPPLDGILEVELSAE